MGLKENIKQRRLELNLTLEEVAKHLNVSKPTIQRYESGVIDNIPYQKIEQLAEVLKVTPSWLMGWEKDFISKDEVKVLRGFLAHLSKLDIDYLIEKNKMSVNSEEVLKLAMKAIRLDKYSK
jgi:transcriptional regulator with XRE-family HTH domain